MSITFDDTPRTVGDFYITEDYTKLIYQLPTIVNLLRGTYWARDRTQEQMVRAISRSLCFPAENFHRRAASNMMPT